MYILPKLGAKMKIDLKIFLFFSSKFNVYLQPFVGYDRPPPTKKKRGTEGLKEYFGWWGAARIVGTGTKEKEEKEEKKKKVPPLTPAPTRARPICFLCTYVQ